MTEPNFTQPTLGKSKKISLKIWLLNLDALSAIGRSIAKGIRFLYTNTTQSSWFLAGLVLLSVTGIFMHNVRLISLAGLIWVSIWLGLFSVAVFIHWIVENAADLLRPRVEEDSIIDKLIEEALQYTRKSTFTVAGLIISIGHMFAQIHIKSASDMPDPLLTFDVSSWRSWLYVVGAPVLGNVIDYFNKNNVRTRGGVMFLLGLFQFYSSFVILSTGVLGGGAAITSIHTIVKEPWALITHDMLEVAYIDSFSHAIFQGIGSIGFGLIYLLIPISLVFFSYTAIQRGKLGVKSSVPVMGLYSVLAVSIMFLIVGLIVSWNEGWIYRLIVVIFELIKRFYYFITSLLS